MAAIRASARVITDPAADMELAQRALAGDGQAFLTIMQAHN